MNSLLNNHNNPEPANDVDTILGVDPDKIFEENEEDGEKGGKKKNKKSAKESKDLKELDKLIQTSHKRKSKEEVEKCQSLVMKLARYGSSERFGEYLKGNGFKLTAGSLNTQTSDELEELFDRVKICVANKSESSMFVDGVLFGTRAVEAMTQRPVLKDKFDLLGWSASLQTNEAFMDSLEELRISSSIVTGLSPEKRLMFALASSAVSVSQTNARIKLGMKELEEKFSFDPAAPATLPTIPEETKTTPTNNSHDFLGLGENKREVDMPPPPETKEQIGPANQIVATSDQHGQYKPRKRKGGPGRPLKHNYDSVDVNHGIVTEESTTKPKKHKSSKKHDNDE